MRSTTLLFVLHINARHILLAIALMVHSLCCGQAMFDDANVTDNEPLIQNIGSNDILPPGVRTYSLITQPAYGNFNWINQQTGIFSLAVEPQVFYYHNFEHFTFDYQVCVGSFCDTATIEILLRFNNDNPFANNDTLYVESGQGRWADVTINDGDEDSLADPLTGNYMTWQLIPPSHADFTASPIDSFPKLYGTFYYQPAADFIGEDYFTYYYQEPIPCLLMSSPARVTIFVVPSNENPVAGDAAITDAIEEVPVAYNLLPLSSDPENEVLHFALTGQPHGGVASVSSSGLLTYTSTNNFIGPDTVVYTVMDLVGQLDTGYIYVQVANGNNDAPLLQNSLAGAQEDANASWSVATPDAVDGDALTYQIIATTSVGEYTVSPVGTINYTPPANFSGTDIIRYRACDAGGLCDTAQVVVTVAPVNDAPIAGNDFNTTVINGTVSGQVANNDSDIDNSSGQLTYLLLDAAIHGSVTVQANGTYTYSPDALYFGEDLFTYRVCDSQGLCDDATVIINVLYTNLAPETQDYAASTEEDQNTVIELSSVTSDFNGGDLSYAVLSPASFGTFSPITNAGFSFEPNNNINGTYTIQYRVCDTGNLCDTALLTIAINPVNDAPNVLPLTLLTQEDIAVAWVPQYNDIDSNNDSLTIEIIAGPSFGILDESLIYHSNENYYGEDAITFTVCDSDGACTEITHSIVITPVNDSPVANNDIVSTAEDTALFGFPLDNNDSDIDGDALTYSLLTAASEHQINFSTTGSMVFIPALNYNGNVQISYSVCDAGGLCDTANVTIEILPVNDVPVSDFPSLIGAEDTPVVFVPQPFTGDIDGDALTYSIVSSFGLNATFNLQDENYTLIPVANYFGEASLVLQTCDGQSACITDTLHIELEAINDAPVLSDLNVFTFVNIPAEGDLSEFIVDADDVTFTAFADNNSLGNLTIDSSLHFSYTPAMDYIGMNSMIITVCDSSGLCDTALFMIEVFPPNQAPQAVESSFETCQAQSFTIPIASLVTDDAQLAEDLNYTLIASGPAQIVVASPATEAVVIPSEFTTGILYIDMIVCDNASPALCDTATYSVDITPSFIPEISGISINHVSCYGANDGSITITGTNDSGNTAFAWSNGGNGSTIDALTPGGYSVLITSDTPCSIASQAAFTINEPTMLESSYSSNNISDNGNGTIDVLISGGTPPYDVQWNGPDGFTSTEQSLMALTEGGIYQASITDDHGCSASLEVVITGTPEELQNDFSVFPNPATQDWLMIRLMAKTVLPAPYSITDLSGKTIQQGALNQYTNKISIAPLASGCYLLVIGGETVKVVR